MTGYPYPPVINTCTTYTMPKSYLDKAFCRFPDSGNTFRFSKKDFGCKVCRQILQLSLLRALNLPTTAPLA